MQTRHNEPDSPNKAQEDDNRMAVIVDFVESIKAQGGSQDKKNTRREWIKVTLEGFTFIAVVVYAVFTYKLMNLSQTHERAWVGLSKDPIRIVKPFICKCGSGSTPTGTARLSLRNGGGTVAFGVNAVGDFIFNGKNPAAEVVKSQTLACNPKSLTGALGPSGQLVFPNMDTEFFEQTVSPLRYSIIVDAQGGTEVYFAGCITYRDNVTSVLHHTKFCLYWVPDDAANPTKPDGTMIGRFEACAFWQHAD